MEKAVASCWAMVSEAVSTPAVEMEAEGARDEMVEGTSTEWTEGEGGGWKAEAELGSEGS